MKDKDKSKDKNKKDEGLSDNLPELTPENIDMQRAYEQLSQEAPVRAVTVPAPTPTLGEAISLSEDLTDMQFAMKHLFPTIVNENSVMIGRIEPQIFLPALHLMSVNEIMQADPAKPIDINAIYMRNYVRLSIGLDGMGRIDTAELVGAAREERKAKEAFGGTLGLH